MQTTKEEMAARLNGRQYTDEITTQDAKDAAENNLVVIFGASDDLTCFYGAISDEAGAWGGATHKVTSTGDLFYDGDNDEDYIRAGWTPPKTAMKIHAEWGPECFGGCWRITPNVPFATFDIFEDDELYCRGAVVDFKRSV